MKEVQAWYNGRGARVVNERQAWYNRWAVVVVTKHLGPGPHPSGSPQSAHAGGNGEEHKKRAIANRFGLGPDEVGFADVTPVKFNQILNRRLPKKYRSYVTRYSPKEYREMKAECFISESGQSGFVLKPDGDIISVFSAPGAKEGKSVVLAAIANGGTKLDCFQGFLSDKFYPRFGFKEYDQWGWDDQYAPAGWDYEKDNRPNVVLMQLGGT